MVLYAVIEILCCLGAEFLISVPPAILFSGAMVLYTSLLTLSPKYRKTKNCCQIIAIIASLFAVAFSIYPFNVYLFNDVHHPLQVLIIAAVFSIIAAVLGLMIFGLTFCFIQIDVYNSLIINKITLSISIIMLFLISVIHCIMYYTETRVMSAYAAMVTCSIAINLMAPKLRNKAVQIILSICSLAFLVFPVIYLIRGYWGFSGEAINAIAIVSVLIALICTIITAIVGMRPETNALETAAPAFAAPTGISPAPAVSPYQPTPQASAPMVNPYQPTPQAPAPMENPYQPTPQAPAPMANPYQPTPQAPTPMANPYQPTPQAPMPMANPYQPTPQASAPMMNAHQAPVDGWTCPGCGFVNTDGGVFCGNCGMRRMAPVAQNENSAWTCPKCGHTLNTGKFCGVCGQRKDQTV